MQPQNYPSSTECHLCQARAISFSKVHSDHRQIIYSNVDDQSSVAAVPQCSAQCGIAVPSAVLQCPVRYCSAQCGRCSAQCGRFHGEGREGGVQLGTQEGAPERWPSC